MTRLCPYEDLNAEQREQLLGIEVLPEQLPFSGDIACALYSLPAQCHPGIRGFALLIDERPVAFMLLKRHPLLAHWSTALAERLRESLATGNRRVMRFLDKEIQQSVTMPTSWQAFTNFNTPEDFQRALTEWEQQCHSAI